MYKPFRIILVFVTVLATGMLIIGLGGYYYQEQVLQQFLQAVNKKLAQPVHVQTIRLAAWTSFPRVTVVLQGVTIQQAPPVAGHWFSAHTVRCSLDVWQLCKKQYAIDQLVVQQGEIILMPDQRSGQAIPTLPTGHLAAVTLQDVRLIYTHPTQRQRYQLHATQLQARIRLAHQQITADFRGKARLGITQALPITLQGSLCYDGPKKRYLLQPTQISHPSASVTLQGQWDQQAVQLTMQGKKIRIQPFLPYLPLARQIAPYQIQGCLTFDLRIHTPPGTRAVPALQANFSLQEGQIKIPNLPHTLAVPQVVGTVHIPHIQDRTTATVNIKDITATWAHSRLQGSCTLRDLDQGHLHARAQTWLDIADSSALFPNQPVQNATGKLILAGELTTRLRQQTPVHFTGTVQAEDVQGYWGKTPLTMAGQVVCKDAGWVVQDVVGQIGEGKFAVRGTIDNWLLHGLKNPKPLAAQLTLYIEDVDLDAVLSGVPITPTPRDTVAPTWLAQSCLTVDYAIQRLRYKRLQAQSVRGRMQLKEQQWILDTLQLGLAGGKVHLQGTLTGTACRQGRASTRLQGVDLAQLLHMVDHFHQRFLQNYPICGDVFADAHLAFQLDQQGQVQWDTLTADVDFRLEKGKLKSLVPLLADYIAEDQLLYLQFATLKNKLHIQNRTLTIPPMAIHANSLQLQLSGTHTFDGKIDYHLVIPLTNLKKAVQHRLAKTLGGDLLAGITLFLRLQGDVQNYQLRYDTAAMKKSLQSKLKEQVKTWQAIIQGTYQASPKTKGLDLDQPLALE